MVIIVANCFANLELLSVLHCRVYYVKNSFSDILPLSNFMDALIYFFLSRFKEFVLKEKFPWDCI